MVLVSLPADDHLLSLACIESNAPFCRPFLDCQQVTLEALSTDGSVARIFYNNMEC